MKRTIYICFAMLWLMVYACKQEELGPTQNDGIAPGQISNATVNNLNGAAEISYEVPKDTD